jgi:hypothetical protein
MVLAWHPSQKNPAKPSQHHAARQLVNDTKASRVGKKLSTGIIEKSYYHKNTVTPTKKPRIS